MRLIVRQVSDLEFKILYLYPDMLDLYGDSGNLSVLKYRLKQRNIKTILDTYTIGDPQPDFTSYDLIFIGGGADSEQQILADDLKQYKKDILNSLEAGVFYLLICGGYQLFGQYYKDANGQEIPGLGIKDYYTVALLDKTKRCVGNIVTEVMLENTPVKIVGFENHGGQTENCTSPFGKVLYGNGNRFGDTNEGYFETNLLGTYLHGPLLSKNPELADYIIKYGLERKYQKPINLEPLNDEFEQKSKQIMLDRLLK